ncbi:MAG TPA: hypothetical protein VFR58_08730 [Flavisolibacter sp.]|nr:hypothetical protein [Flavisolibacter sp.]
MLHAKFTTVIPIFYWASREGNSLVKKSFKQPVRIVALYPRRPKVTGTTSDSIYVKFNEELFYWNEEFALEGIPVFAGMPLANSLENFHYHTKCLWFKIHRLGHEETILIDLHNENSVRSTNISSILEDEIIQTIWHETKILDWSYFCRLIKEIKRKADYKFNRSRFNNISYKPAYFILME